MMPCLLFQPGVRRLLSSRLGRRAKARPASLSPKSDRGVAYPPIRRPKKSWEDPGNGENGGEEEEKGEVKEKEREREREKKEGEKGDKKGKNKRWLKDGATNDGGGPQTLKHAHPQKCQDTKVQQAHVLTHAV